MASDLSAKRQRIDDGWCISAQNVVDLRSVGPNFLKLVVSNETASVPLGAGGSYLKELQHSGQCCVKFSPPKHFYPGSGGQRVVAVSGTEEAMDTAISAMVASCAEADRQLAEREDRPQDGRTKLQAAIPNTACGLVIGKKGIMQKEISEETGVKIQIAKIAEVTVDGERLVSFAGPVDSVIAAVSKVCKLIQQDATLSQHLETPADAGSVRTRSAPSPVAANWTPAPAARWAPASEAPSTSRHLAISEGSSNDWDCTITFEVTEGEAAHIIGKGGAFLQSVIQETGAKVLLSKRGQQVPGIKHRQVSISGRMSEVHAAHALVLDRVHTKKAVSSW